MKIRRIAAYRVELPLHEGSYKWSGGKSVAVFDSTIVRVETDAGLVGHGEVCPLGPFYLPAYAEGVRAGLAELGPHLLGEDPTQLERLNRRMDALLKGHPYVKSGIDIACWDILGQATGLPVCVAARRPLRRGLRPLSRHLAGIARGDGGEGRRATAPRDTGASSSRSGGDPDVDIERIRAVAAMLAAGRPPDRRRQHRLAAARGGAGRARRARRRRVHRAALPDVRRVPVDPPADRSSVRARRDDRRPRHAAARGRPISRWTWSTSRSASSAA